MAFGHLKERTDFASYAFFPAPKRCRWSDERERGFVAAVSRNGGHAYVFSSPSAAGSERRRRNAAEWLASLPKPCAVFAAADMCAVQVLDAAHRSKLDVPGQVAVLGTDNDTNLALYSDPPLSSVLPGHADMGYAAAEALERLMSGRPVRRIVSIPAVGVIDRESTALSASASVLVRRALDYISLNACTGIGIPDVVRHLGASRRLVERRFREVAGKSIRETIEEFRLAKVEQLLKGTTLTLEQISSDCGFSSAARLSHLYKQRFGQPPVRSCRRLVKSVLVAGAAAVLVIFFCKIPPCAPDQFCDILRITFWNVGLWRNWLAHWTVDPGVAGSSPVDPASTEGNKRDCLVV